MHAKLLQLHVQLFVTLWTVACQAPLSLGFSRQEYRCGLPCPPPGNLPDPGIEPASPVAPALQGKSLPLSHWGSMQYRIGITNNRKMSKWRHRKLSNVFRIERPEFKQKLSNWRAHILIVTPQVSECVIWCHISLCVSSVWNSLPAPFHHLVSCYSPFKFMKSFPDPTGRVRYGLSSLPPKHMAYAAAAAAKSIQSWPTLCDPIDGSPPGSPIPGILQARILEWVAIAFSEHGI